jgi:hypothetical protein
LCLFTGLTALWGGLELVWRPDGSLVGLPFSLLERTAFRDFLVPGLLLAGFVGGINALAGVLLLRRHPRADSEAMVSGAVLATWIIVEVLLIRHVHWLHGVYLTLGLAISGIAVLRERRTGELESTTRAVARLVSHVFVGWVAYRVTTVTLLATTSAGAALLVHALAAPLVFVGVAKSYFRSRYAWAPIRAAVLFAVLVGMFDLVVVANFIERSLATFQSFVGSWLPLCLIASTTWIVGTLRKHRPSSREASRPMSTVR